MSKRFPNPRRVKIHYAYTVEEVARLLDLHKNTVRAWINQGLPLCDDRRPMIILGQDLAAFLRRKRVAGKRPCQPDQLYCLRCRRPQVPAGRMADYQALSASTGNLVALCPDCEGLMYRRVRRDQLPEIAMRLELATPTLPA